MQQQMNDTEYKTLRSLIENEFGLSLSAHTKESLARKVQPRLNLLRLESFGEYVDYLMQSPMAKIELHDLPVYLMNTESYFLREYTQFELFVELFRKKNQERHVQRKRPFTILSAGCSEGQEPYSISMALRNSTSSHDYGNMKIFGLDININALEKAQRGLYGSYSFRGLHNEKIMHYFQKTKDRFCDLPKECYRLKTDIVKSVEYLHGNILQPLVLQGLANLDFIFCRNVLMYMSGKAIDKITMSLWEALSDDGYLFIGQSETLRKRDDLFTQVSFPEVTVYRKKRGF
jgi:chemotaxis protein methyltransferase CheR